MSRTILRIITLSIAMLALGAASPIQADEAKKVSQAEALRNVVTRVQPDYPATARQLRIQGIVELQIVISDTGAVEEVSIVSGNPMLTRPAVEALRKWKFTPFTADGKAIRAQTQLSVAFKL